MAAPFAPQREITARAYPTSDLLPLRVQPHHSRQHMTGHVRSWYAMSNALGGHALVDANA